MSSDKAGKIDDPIRPPGTGDKNLPTAPVVPCLRSRLAPVPPPEHLSPKLELHERLAACVGRRNASRARRVLAAFGPLALTRLARSVGLTTGRSFRVRAETFWGGRMIVRLPEELSEQILTYHFFDPQLSAIFLEKVRSAMKVLDVGAHYGYFSLLASELVGSSGEVHSFEPTPASFELLAANVAGRANITINRVAVWREPTELEMSDLGPKMSLYNSVFAPRLERTSTSARKIEVPAVSVDHYVRERDLRPDLVKIDAESSELQVIEGMLETIRRYSPLITVEVGDMDVPGAPNSRSLVDRLTHLGYKPLEYSNGRLGPHAPRRRYCYANLLFAPT
jgi:FkbM family methyltransferase